jgi:hypothetical protein
MRMAGREFLAKERKIRATLSVELPYDNELLCYNNKLNDRIVAVLQQRSFACEVRTGTDLPWTGIPIITEKENESG